jgi:hypothetical protein
METTTQREIELELENKRLKEELRRTIDGSKYSVEIYTSEPLKSCGDHVEFGQSQLMSLVFGCGFTDKDWEFVESDDCDLHYRITVERI